MRHFNQRGSDRAVLQVHVQLVREVLDVRLQLATLLPGRPRLQL